MHLYSAEALRVSKALEHCQSVVSKQESFKITTENVVAVPSNNLLTVTITLVARDYLV